MICAIDVETGGLNHKEDSILSIAIIPKDGPRFIARMYDPKKKVNDEALAVNKLFDYREYPTVDIIGPQLLEYLDSNKFLVEPLGHFVQFDLSFVRELIGDFFFNKYFNTRCTRCSKQLLTTLIDAGLYEGSTSLGKACEAFGIPLVDAHNSEADAVASYNLYFEIVERIKFNKLEIK